MDRDELRALRERVESLSSELRQLQLRLMRLEREAADEAHGSASALPHAPAPTPPPLPGKPQAIHPPPVDDVALESPVEEAPIPAASPAKETPRPVPKAPVRESESAINLVALWRKFGPPQDLSWEMALGTWWLPRIGMVVLAVAVVWLMSLAIGQIPPTWLPALRLGLGVAVAVGLLVTGRFLETRSEAYARVLLAGGIALSYLVAFGTHYLPYTRIFESPAPTLALLAVIVALWTAVAQWRSSRILAFGVTVLGHFTVGLSSVTLDTPHPLAVFGLVALAAGSAFFLWRNGWITVAVAGVLGAYGNYFLWLAQSPGAEIFAAFVSAMAVLVLFFAIFALADFFAPESFRREEKHRTWRALYVGLNAVGLTLLGALLIQGFDFARPHDHYFYFAVGLSLLALSAAYARMRNGDPLYHAYLSKGIVVSTIGAITLFDGGRLLATLAIEGLVLLLAARRPGMIAARVLAFASVTAAMVYGAWIYLYDFGTLTLGATPWGAGLSLGLSALALLAMAECYRRTDWTLFSPATAPFNPEIKRWLWQLDLINEGPSGEGKVLGGLLLPYGLAASAALLLWALIPQAAPTTWQAVLLAGSGLALLLAATMVSALPWSLAALLLFAGAWLRHIPLYFDNYILYGALCLLLLAPQALATEQRWVGRRKGLQLHQYPFMPYILYGLLGMGIALLFLRLVDNSPDAAKAMVGVRHFALIAWAAACLSLVLHRRALGFLSVAYFTVACLFWLAETFGSRSVIDPRSYWHLAAWGLFVSLVLVERLFARRPADHLLRSYGAVLLTLGALVGTAYLVKAPPTTYLHTCLTALALAFLGHGVLFQRKTSFVLSLLIASGATFSLLGNAYTSSLDDQTLLAGFGALTVFWGILERGQARYRKFAPNVPETPELSLILTAIPVVLLMVLFERMPLVGDAYLSIAWTLVAVASFGVSLVFHQRNYRYAGLILLAIVLARVFLIDTARLEPVFRIAAGALLGLVMLAIGYGYVYARQRNKDTEPKA